MKRGKGKGEIMVVASKALNFCFLLTRVHLYESDLSFFLVGWIHFFVLFYCFYFGLVSPLGLSLHLSSTCKSFFEFSYE